MDGGNYVKKKRKKKVTRYMKNIISTFCCGAVRTRARGQTLSE